MHKIKILRNGVNLEYKSFIFPGGEIGVKLEIPPVAFSSKTGFFAPSDHQTIIARIQESEDLIRLAMIKDALEKIDRTPINLFLPYLPYARQDRVCDTGESFSLKVFCNLINNLNFNQVIICDPHSEVSPALLNNVMVISQLDIINKYLAFINVAKQSTLISPDAGANKKISLLAGYLEHKEFVRADKLRDLSNGKIKETIVYSDDLKGRNCLIVDDICDGGRTFIELAKVLKSKNAGKIILYITHAIFSQGVKTLFINGIDEIWTTNSFDWVSSNEDYIFDDKVNVLSLEEKFSDLL